MNKKQKRTAEKLDLLGAPLCHSNSQLHIRSADYWENSM
jgi:hypothetical protein